MSREYWRQLPQPLPFIPMFDGSMSFVPQSPQSGSSGVVPVSVENATPDAMLNQLVEQYLAGVQGAGDTDPSAASELDPSQRKELEQAIKDRFQQLNQNGLSLEGRPGSKASEALATGDLSNLSKEELMQLLVSLMEYADNRRNPNSVARQQSAPLAPTGSWGSNGNSAGGGTSYTGANSNSAAAAGPAPKAGPIPEGTPSGHKLAVTAQNVAQSMNSTGWCYRGVSTAVAQATGVQLTGGSAYMAADQLASNSKFKEISVSPDQLKSLPPGAIVVWGKTAASEHGHISVSLGNGQEASDHIQSQMTSLRGAQNYRVFVLRDG